MRTFDKGTCITRLLLAGCALGSALSLPAQAGDGRIIIQREVQPRMATRAPITPDPNPVTMSTSPASFVIRQTGELSDRDFADISSGAGIKSMILQQTTPLGGNLNTQNQLPNLSGGRGSGDGNGIANMVNSNVQQGLGALKVLSGGK